MILTRAQNYFPGFVVAAIIGLAAQFLSEHYGAPAMLFALLLGIALSFLYEETKCKAGTDWTAKFILRVGVALLGLRVAWDDLASLGWGTAGLLLLGIISTIAIGILFARILGLQKSFGALSGGATAICGASAAMAISSAMPDHKDKEDHTILTVIGVTSLSTIAMVIYPIFAQALGFNDSEAGIFIGGTIHDVAQVVGAGFSISEEAGDLATLTKLVRVSFLMPVVICFVIFFRFRKTQGAANGKAQSLPKFLIVFAVLMFLNSVMQIPMEIKEAASATARFCLIASIAAIGMKSNLRQLLRVGFKPVFLMIIETTWLCGLIMAALVYL